MNEEVLKKLITSLNRHIPKSRVSLYDALRSAKPGYVGRDGREYSILKGELEILSGLLPEERWHFLKVPIIIRGDPSGESPCWIVSGKDECRVLASVSGKSILSEREVDEIKLYMPHLLDIRRALPTTAVIMTSL